MQLVRAVTPKTLLGVEVLPEHAQVCVVPGKWVVFFPVPGKWVVLFFRYLENVLFSVPGKWVALFWTLLGRTKNIKFFRFWGGEILLFF